MANFDIWNTVGRVINDREKSDAIYNKMLDLFSIRRQSEPLLLWAAILIENQNAPVCVLQVDLLPTVLNYQELCKALPTDLMSDDRALTLRNLKFLDYHSTNRQELENLIRQEIEKVLPLSDMSSTFRVITPLLQNGENGGVRIIIEERESVEIFSRGFRDVKYNGMLYRITPIDLDAKIELGHSSPFFRIIGVSGNTNIHIGSLFRMEVKPGLKETPPFPEIHLSIKQASKLRLLMWKLFKS